MIDNPFGVSGCQGAGLASGIQGDGLDSGVVAFHQKCGPGYGD